MVNTLLIFTEDNELIKLLNKTLASMSFNTLFINSALDIHSEHINLAIIDCSCLDCANFIAKLNLQQGEYIPIIAIAKNDKISIDPSNIDFVIEVEDIEYMLPKICVNFLRFKTKFNDLKHCYNTMNLINNETEKLLNNISNEPANFLNPIESLIRHIFIINKDVMSKPSLIFTIDKNDKNIAVTAYSCYGNILLKNPTQNFIDFRTFEYLSSFMSNTLDINNTHIDALRNYFSILKCDFLTSKDAIKNYTYHSCGDALTIALNYNNTITRHDWDIIKDFTINFGMLTKINLQLSNVNNAFEYTANALARAAEAEDDETGTHIKRVNEYSRLISERLGLDSRFVEKIHFSAQMHDVGKLHVPQIILQKPGKLTSEEFDLMKQHTIFGAQIIGDSPQLSMAFDIALNHHEKFDGTGYPNGISGYDIPLPARVVALADIYDALRSVRKYKPSFSHMEALNIITKGDGRVMPSHFDPEILNIFAKFHSDFECIYSIK